MNGDSLRRPVALVTGGTRGIGLGIARALAAAGFDLALNGVRSEEQVASVVEELCGSGVRCIYCRGDVSSAADRGRIVAGVREAFGRIDVLVNNAGVAPAERRDLLEASEESFERLIRTNLQGPYFLTQLVAREMVETRRTDPGFRGCIVTISSISSTCASVNRGEYCVAKAGLSMLTKLFAARLGEYDIPVYEVRPGVIATDMTACVRELYDGMLADGLALQRRWGLPEDVGRAVATLATGGLPYATGQVIRIDGGLGVERL
ncbi:MAG: 3-ketoacyl-ACP reductase [Alistipes sp.]|nr:3-ketoacyl-ACP reductase [Alistipes sp.]